MWLLRAINAVHFMAIFYLSANEVWCFLNETIQLHFLKCFFHFCFSLLGTVCCPYPFHCEELQFEPSVPLECIDKKGMTTSPILHIACNIPVITYQDCFYCFLQCYIIDSAVIHISTLVVFSSAAV